MAELRVEARLDMTKLLTEEEVAEEILRRLNAEVEQSQHKLRTGVRTTFRFITSLIGTMRSVAACFGVAIPPIFDAIMGAVTATVLAMQAIAAAYAAGGVTIWLVAPLEAAAIGLAWAAVMAVAMGQQSVNSDFANVENTLRGLGTTANSFERMIEGF